MFSLCIATMDRYDQFLSKFIPKYLENPLIKEIIISDENGKDNEKIKANFLPHIGEKIFCFTNDQRLGPFLNKLNALKHSQNHWVSLIDSDNFAPEKYFVEAKKYIEAINLESFTILMPSFAMPNFNYKNLPEQFTLKTKTKQFDVCFNTGNYIMSRDIFETLSIENDKEIISNSSACDVILFNTMVLEQIPSVKIFIVKTLEYNHTVHNGSVYLNTYQAKQAFNHQVHERFHRLFHNIPHRIRDEKFYCPNKDVYPPYKSGHYLEEYFLHYFYKHEPKTSRTYIPALWTNFQIEGWFQGKKKEMQVSLNNWVKEHPSPNGYFTVVQYDDACLLQVPPNTKIFGACSGDVPIPLIYEDVDNKLKNQPKLNFKDKIILCSFVGSMTSNNIQPNVRQIMKQTLQGKEGFSINFTNGWTPNVGKQAQDLFIDTTLKSKFALAPRGYGRSSFRFFEILQLGTIPIYIWNDKNWLPFQDKIKYNEFSVVLQIKQISALEEKLLSITEEKYNQMLEAYKRYEHLFTLEGMSEEILQNL